MTGLLYAFTDNYRCFDRECACIVHSVFSFCMSTLCILHTGPVDCSKSIVLSNSNTMVARRGVYNAVSVEAKDTHGNNTIMDVTKLDMVVVKVSVCVCVCVCVCACVHACVPACLPACLRACVRACVCACVVSKCVCVYIMYMCL